MHRSLVTVGQENHCGLEYEEGHSAGAGRDVHTINTGNMLCKRASGQ